MNDKEFVLVSQGMEIMRTKSQENAINYVKKENDEWFDYKQRCIDNYEDYADNYIDLEIEYPEDKRYLQLQSNWNSLRELIEIDNKRAKGYIERIRTSDLCHGDYPVEYFYAEKRKEITDYYLDKMNELEGKDKE